MIDARSLKAGRYLVPRYIVVDATGRCEYGLGILTIAEYPFCVIYTPFKAETPSTIQLDAPVIFSALGE